MLTQEINKLLSEAEKTVSEMTNGKENYPDPNDRASLESDRNFELRIRDRERKLISKMREAIQRIDNGTYGICTSCGGDISEKTVDGKTGHDALHRLQDQAGENGKAHGRITPPVPFIIPSKH